MDRLIDIKSTDIVCCLINRFIFFHYVWYRVKAMGVNQEIINISVIPRRNHKTVQTIIWNTQQDCVLPKNRSRFNSRTLVLEKYGAWEQVGISCHFSLLNLKVVFEYPLRSKSKIVNANTCRNVRNGLLCHSRRCIQSFSRFFLASLEYSF